MIQRLKSALLYMKRAPRILICSQMKCTIVSKPKLMKLAIELKFPEYIKKLYFCIFITPAPDVC